MKGIMSLRDPQMKGLSAEEQAKKALNHILNRIRVDPIIGWYLGYGTQSFSLLTEAYAALFSKSLKEVQDEFMPENPRDPFDKTAP
jgi:hypothetical protein